MIEEQLKVLKGFNDATKGMDLNAFSKKLNLTTAETIEQMKQLAKEGFLQKVGGGYGIAHKGKAALKALLPVPEGMSFQFYCALTQPIQLSAATLKEFYLAVRQVSLESLEFHLYRSDFENWVRDAGKDPELAHEISHLREDEIRGDELRTELLKLLDNAYSIRELI